MDVVMHTQAHSVGRIRDGEFFAANLITGHTSTGICCSTQNAEIFLLYQDKHTCSRVSCFEIVSFSIFLIFFMSLLTWNSCSCSKCCSNSAFSCWSWDGKGEGSAWREEKRRWMKWERWEKVQEKTHGESHENYLMTTVNKYTGVRSFWLHTKSIAKQEVSVIILPDSWFNFLKEETI